MRYLLIILYWLNTSIILNNFYAQILPPSASATIKNEWSIQPFSEKYFTENKGQWKKTILNGQNIIAAYDGQSEDYFFTKTGIQIELINKKWKKEEEDDEHEKYHKEEEYALKEKRHIIYGEWLNTSPNVQVLMQEKNTFYTSYSYKEFNETKNINFIPTYKKILYKNIYPNIDIEYTLHPKGGYKYNIIVHPGGDISQVKFKYSQKSKQKNNLIYTSTPLGSIIDHTPIAYYEKSRQPISCNYLLQNNIISFQFNDTPINETIIIDPWTQMPNFPSTNWDCVWECERDGAGNVYIIGGTSPMQLIKYNSSGTLQWTYNTPYDTSAWLGTFAVDNAGNSYVTQGSTAQIQKINTSGSLVWNNTSPTGSFNSAEFWNISFNCNQSKLVIAGTNMPLMSTNPLPYIFNVDVNTGNITMSVQVGGPGGLINPGPQEVRAITSCSNANYYYLTHDSIGFIKDNLSTCGPNTFPFHTANNIRYAYKCENFRKNNCGLEALAYSNFNGFVYLNKGDQVQKRDFATGAVVASATIPGGSLTGTAGNRQAGNSGIAIDNCGNVYVGSTNGVYKFDANLNPLASYATSFNVYDVEVNSGGEVIACGSTGNSSSTSRTGYIQSFAASACAPQNLICCDPNICPPPQKCQNDPPFTFSVSTPGGTFSASCGSCINSSTGSFTPSVAGAGTFVVTYALSCGSQSTQVVVAPCATLNVCSQPSGSLQVSGGTPSYTWAYQTSSVNCSGCTIGCTFPPGCSVSVNYWANYATGSVTAPPPNYPIRITDATGSTIQINSAASITPCTSCPVISITPVVQNALCNGGSGSATVSASGGTGPYTYTWMPGTLTGSVQSNLTPGTIYTITAKDNNSCTGTITLSITQPSAISATLSASNATCTAANGGATITTISGGTAPYTYTWLPSGGNASVANNIAAGNYSVIIKDANDCTLTKTISINSSTNIITTSVNIQNASCSAGGSATIIPSNGNAPYTYTWIPAGGSNSVATGLSIGNYTVQISDNFGCSSYTTLTIGGTGVAIQTIQTQSVSCYAGTNGSATVSITGGTAPYSYTWSPAVSTNSYAANLSAGSYTVFISDNSNCTATTVVNITQPSDFTISVNGTSVSCNGGSNGSATVNVSGGTGPYNYTWAPTGGNSYTATNLSAGSYTINILDANGCSTSQTLNIYQPGALTVNITSTNSCGSNATATVNVNGGTPAYSYTWLPTGGNASVATNLPPGSYTVLVTDNHSCNASGTFTVSSSSISYTITTDSVDCNGSATGSASISVAGGMAPYTYTWLPNGGNSNAANNLSAGNYTVLVNDNAGCQLTTTLNILQPSIITLNTSASASVCLNNTLNITALASGGNGGYSYHWNPGGIVNNGTLNVSPTATSVYSVYAQDIKGCTSSVYTIEIYVYPVLSAVGNTITVCENAPFVLSPSITSIGNGGPYSYTWNTGVTSSSISGVGNASTSPNNYTVIISDGCNAPVNVYFSVNVTAAPVSSFTADITKGCPPVRVNFVASNYNSAYTYTWNLGNGQTATGYSVSSNYSNVGYYDVSLTVSNGACASSTSYSNYIQVYPYPVAGFDANPWVTSEFEPTVSFTSTSQGAVSFNWFFNDFGSGANNTSSLPNPTHIFSQAGTYSVALVVYNSYGCRDEIVKIVTVEPEFHIYIPNTFTPDGNGLNDVFICKGMGIDPSNFEMLIFDRWGELIYKTNDFYQGWDGTVKGKKNMAMQGVYIYKIKVYDLKGKKHEYVGHLTCLPGSTEF